MKSFFRFVLSLAALCFSDLVYANSEQPVLFQCSLNQKLLFNYNDALGTPLPLSKKIAVEILFYKHNREAFIRMERIKSWERSIMEFNPDFYGFAIRESIITKKMSPRFYINRNSLFFYTDRMDNGDVDFFTSYDESLKSDLKDFFKTVDGKEVTRVRLLGECKIGSYVEPKI